MLRVKGWAKNFPRGISLVDQDGLHWKCVGEEKDLKKNSMAFNVVYIILVGSGY